MVLMLLLPHSLPSPPPPLQTTTSPHLTAIHSQLVVSASVCVCVFPPRTTPPPTSICVSDHQCWIQPRLPPTEQRWIVHDRSQVPSRLLGFMKGRVSEERVWT